MERRAELKRSTRETDINLKLNIDGSGKCNVATGIGFFDHMLELFARHSLIDLDLRVKGDIEVDYHHTVEDTGLVLGHCLNEALGDRSGITRYGSMLLPMDETLCQVALDLGGRPFLSFASPLKYMQVRDFDVKLVEEFFRGVVQNARMNLHIRQISGDETHHFCEAVFKGFARAMRIAVAIDPRQPGIPSSKGVI